ncbi:MAG: phage head closure protein [Lachnospiraceae bacterium]|nr:phage head closure protein [Lachnospiraceae bacterium]
MDIGRTNKRITFCRYEEKENDLSQMEQVLTEVKTVWASVEPTRGREYQEAQRIRPELTYKITTRYHKEVTPDMLIKFKDCFFEIVSIINVREQNAMLEIICTEKITESRFLTQKELEKRVFDD